ncbi:MAG: twin-arginine translocation signal domain-containing protein, partial [Deltaproteobacteria bacterium]|nr:twin-arginine translocation signal domain-containing protein [Deltaproteobacteria bacterium]
MRQKSEITRRRFLEAAGIGAVALGPATVLLGGTANASSSENPDREHIRRPNGEPAIAGDPEICVMGTASNPQDAINLQWVMDNIQVNGTARLSGRFHLSDVDADGEFIYSPVQIRQDYAPWYGDHYQGLPMYFIPGTAMRYVEYEVEAPPEPAHPEQTVPHYVDPYLGIPLFPSAAPMPKIPVMVDASNDRRILITRSVHIVGDRQGGQYNATIVGGFYTFTIGMAPFDPISGQPVEVRQDFFFDSTLNFPWESVRWKALDPYQPWIGYVDPERTLDVTIKDLEFTDARAGTILCTATTGLTIKGNHFVDMRGFDLASWSLVPGESLAGIHHPEAYFIIMPSSGQGTIPDLAKDLNTGNIVISDNVFDGRAREVQVTPAGDGPCPSDCFEQHVVTDHTTLATEVFWVPHGVNAQARRFPQEHLPDVLGWRGATAGGRLMLMNADVLITRNTVVDLQGIGFGCESNYGTNLVTDNHFEVSEIPEGADRPWGAIWVSDSHWSGRRYLSQTTVTGNTIVDFNPYTYDIVAFDVDGAVFTDNDIEMLNPQKERIAVFLFSCRDSTFGHNTVWGSADLDFILIGTPEWGEPGTPEYVPAYPCSGNEFIGNNIAKTTVNLTYLLLELTHDNVVRGYTGGSDLVLDLNPYGPYADMPNYLTGVTPMSGAGGAGDSAREAAQQRKIAIARWHETLKTLRKEFGH